MKKVIELNSIELSDILGIGDGHIKLIESSIPVSIAARGDQFFIQGNKKPKNTFFSLSCLFIFKYFYSFKFSQFYCSQ